MVWISLLVQGQFFMMHQFDSFCVTRTHPLFCSRSPQGPKVPRVITPANFWMTWWRTTPTLWDLWGTQTKPSMSRCRSRCRRSKTWWIERKLKFCTSYITSQLQQVQSHRCDLLLPKKRMLLFMSLNSFTLFQNITYTYILYILYSTLHYIVWCPRKHMFYGCTLHFMKKKSLNYKHLQKN